MKKSFGFTPLEMCNPKTNLRLPSGNLSLTGFTLVEMLLAVAIASVVMMTLYSSFSLGLRCWRRAENKTDYEAYTIFLQISRQLRSAYLGTDNQQSFSFQGNTSSLHFTTAFFPNEEALSRPETNLREVRYYLVNNQKFDTRALAYSSFDALASKKTEQEKIVYLTKNLTSLEFSFYDKGSWKKEWNLSNQLPAAVKISVTLQNKQKNFPAESFITAAELPCAYRGRK